VLCRERELHLSEIKWVSNSKNRFDLGVIGDRDRSPNGRSSERYGRGSDRSREPKRVGLPASCQLKPPGTFQIRMKSFIDCLPGSGALAAPELLSPAIGQKLAGAAL
jgi:hypothetical protein